MKTSSLLKMFTASGCLIVMSGAVIAGVPQVDSWVTQYSGKYARIYTTTADLNSGNGVTTWSRNSLSQSSPAYTGVQEIYSSTNWVYIRSTGLGIHTMGPWYLDTGKSTLFPNLPVNTKTFYRFPLSSTNAPIKTLTGLGSIGYFVDGVAMFDGRDGYVWTGSAESNSGTGYWNRDAFVNEYPSFDPAFAHQEQTGTYHYHVNPIALRYVLGDNVIFNSNTKTYSENTNNVNLKHSPILGWMRDGCPLYGPYGYSNPTNPASGVRRMISGFVLRNGQNNSDNLTAIGRSTVPAWATRAYNLTNNNQTGPAVSTTYPLGRYMEDNAYLGDLGKTQGVDFDLNEYNCRFCVTPEFPNGTNAYFVCISANGTPGFPYNIGRAYYGSPTGGGVTSFTESVTTNFLGGPNLAPSLSNPAKSATNNTVTLVWSSIEGGTYQIQSSTNLANWADKATNILAQGTSTQTNFATSGMEFFRAARTSIATYDPVSGTGGGTGSANGIVSISPTSGNRGTSVTATITLDSNANPAVPPQNAPINSLTLGTISGTSISRPTQYTIQATFSIPANVTPGAQTITVVFPGPPANPTQTVTYTLPNGFTVN